MNFSVIDEYDLSDEYKSPTPNDRDRDRNTPTLNAISAESIYAYRYMQHRKAAQGT
jgi:hypothetical protein